MSEFFAVSENDSVYASLEKNSIKEKKLIKFKLLKVLAIVLALVIVVELALYFIIIPCSVPVRIILSGTQSVPAEDLYALLGLNGTETWLACDSAVMAARLVVSPLFESVRVEKAFPDQVRISVVERSAVAIAFTEINGKTIPVQIDKNGVVFKVDDGIPTSILPLITGLEFDNPRPGMRLNPGLRPLMEQLAVLQEESPMYISSLSEIRIEPKSYGSYELILYPVNPHIKVRTDRILNEQTLKHMMIVLDVIGPFASSVEEVDLRYGSISYRMKESLY